MEPKLPAFIVLGWREEIDYWNLVAVADSEIEAHEKRDIWTSKGERDLHVLAVSEVLRQE